MKQWDVFVNPSARMRDLLPLVVLVQSDLLSSFETRWITPLARQDLRGRPRSTGRLMPTFEIAGQSYCLVPQETAPILTRSLGKPVATLHDEWHAIVGALDAVISGV
jgi:toxin CcdB